MHAVGGVRNADRPENLVVGRRHRGGDGREALDVLFVVDRVTAFPDRFELLEEFSPVSDRVLCVAAEPGLIEYLFDFGRREMCENRLAGGGRMEHRPASAQGGARADRMFALRDPDVDGVPVLLHQKLDPFFGLGGEFFQFRLDRGVHRVAVFRVLPDVYVQDTERVSVPVPHETLVFLQRLVM